MGADLKLVPGVMYWVCKSRDQMRAIMIGEIAPRVTHMIKNTQYNEYNVHFIDSGYTLIFKLVLPANNHLSARLRLH